MNKVTGLRIGLLLCSMVLVAGCAGGSGGSVKPGSSVPSKSAAGSAYQIGPGDTLQVFVWRNEDFSAIVPVRPDGRISTPLVEDIIAVGKTPTQLAREIEQRLSTYIKNPVATVIVTGFIGQTENQIRVIGEATQPQAIPYQEGMSVLDVMIAVGGLTEFAAGNRATIVRNVQGKRQELRVRLKDLLSNGDIDANRDMQPGDILVIPRSWF
jgi:polysaccharide export outer membrane protein